MISKTLIKLIDQAILPAVLLFCVRVISILIIARLLDVSYEIGKDGFVFTNPQEYLLVNSYSVLSLVVILCIGTMYVLTKALFFHDTHITPFLTAKLFSLKLSHFIQSSFDIYSQAFIWLMYSYLLMVLTWIFSLFNYVYSWVFFSSLVLTCIQTVLLVIDVEDEIETNNIQSDNFEDGEEDLTYA